MLLDDREFLDVWRLAAAQTGLGWKSSHKLAVLFTGWSVPFFIGLGFFKLQILRTGSVFVTRHRGPDSVGFLEKI